MALDDQYPLDPSSFPGYTPLPMPNDPSALSSRPHPYYEGFKAGGLEPLPSYGFDLYDYFSGLARGGLPQNKALLDEARKKKRPAWLDRLGDVGDAIADALSSRKPYFTPQGRRGEVPRFSSGGGGGELGRFDPERPGHLDTIGLLYLQRLAQQLAGESMQSLQGNDALRSAYRPQKDEGASRA